MPKASASGSGKGTGDRKGRPKSFGSLMPSKREAKKMDGEEVRAAVREYLSKGGRIIRLKDQVAPPREFSANPRPDVVHVSEAECQWDGIARIKP